MRRMCLLLVAAAAGSGGCQLAVNAARNAVNEPALAWDQHKFHKKCRAMAAEAWRQYDPADAASADFRDGFIDGYADYLESGGSGDPPSQPPHRYTRVRYQTPAGLRAIEDYYTGFRRGSAAAIASGDRQLLVVPVLVPVPADGPPGVPVVPIPVVPAPVAPVLPPAELLPDAKPPDGKLPEPKLPEPRLPDPRPIEPVRPEPTSSDLLPPELKAPTLTPPAAR